MTDDLRITTAVSESMLVLLGSVLRPKSALYVCGALSSGLSYYERQAAGDVVDMNEVRADNERTMSALADRLRDTRPEPVIDPGPLRVEGWEGVDYGTFFIDVMVLFAREVHLCDGWQFSRGATKEFVRCVREDIPTYDERGVRVSAEEGKAAIMDALSHLKQLGITADRLAYRVSQLEDRSLQ